MNILEVANLSAVAGTKKVLNGLSLEIEKGTTNILMGPNGAGKSTLARILAGAAEYTVTSGKIIMNEQDLTEADATARARAGIFMTFQAPPEVSGLSLELFIRTAIAQRTGERVKLFAFQKELKEKMAFLSIPEGYSARDLNVGFSGGERKKCEILQLLMVKPAFAVLDEVDSGLDVDATKIVAAGIARYKKECGGTLLIITHSTRLIAELGVDKAFVLAGGRIVDTGGAALVEQVNAAGFDKYTAD